MSESKVTDKFKVGNKKQKCIQRVTSVRWKNKRCPIFLYPNSKNIYQLSLTKKKNVFLREPGIMYHTCDDSYMVYSG